MKHYLRRYTPLAALIALAFFPFGWLTRIWPLAEAVGDFLFPGEAANAVGHTLLFMAIGAALLLGFPALWRRPALYFALILAVALGQEGFQLLYKERGVRLNDLVDIATDLAAAGLVLALWYISKGAPASVLAPKRLEPRREPYVTSYSRDSDHDPASRRRG